MITFYYHIKVFLNNNYINDLGLVYRAITTITYYRYPYGI